MEDQLAIDRMYNILNINRKTILQFNSTLALNLIPSGTRADRSVMYSKDGDETSEVGTTGFNGRGHNTTQYLLQIMTLRRLPDTS